MRDGLRVGQWEASIGVIATTFGLDPSVLGTEARSPEVLAEIRASTAEFHALKMTVRPAFLIENGIGDRAVLSGLANAKPIEAVLEAMLADAQSYASYTAHHGSPPKN